jgi:hypothetical protein
LHLFKEDFAAENRISESSAAAVLNGRVLGDMLGHYTCYTPNGASVVDYVMVSEGILDQVLYFKVTNFFQYNQEYPCQVLGYMPSH